MKTNIVDRWEYRVEYIAYIPDNLEEESPEYIKDPSPWKRGLIHPESLSMELQLNDFGKEGWEVVSINEELLNGKAWDGYILLKRRIVHDTR